MIATPSYPYNVNSVWNRNQLAGLGAIDLGSPVTLILVGLIAWWMYKSMRKSSR